MRVNMSATDVTYVDPALSYYTIDWQIMYQTQTMLATFPERPSNTPAGVTIRPEGAVGLPRVSRNGRVYTFTIRRGFRFSDGRPVTARNFAYAFHRNLNSRMNSPSVPFIDDIVGAQAVIQGRAQRASGVQVRGNRLIIRWTRPRPDFLSIIAMPFFSAIPTNLPIEPRGVNAHRGWGSGPYYIVSRTPARQIVLQRNRFYRGGPIHPRPNFNRIVFTVNTNIDQSLLQVRRGEADYDIGGLPPTAHAALGRQYGVNRRNGQYHVIAEPTTFYWALNTSRPFFNRVNVRKAVNHVIDRPLLTTQRGAYAGTPHDQLLPKGFPGFRDARIYPLRSPRRADINRARQLARGAPNRRAVLFTTDSPIGLAWAQVMIRDMGRIGIQVEHRRFRGGAIYTEGGRRNSEHDIMSAGWHADYADPLNFVDILLSGRNIQEANNNNFSYFNSPTFNRKMAAAARLTGPRRYRAWGNIDIEIMRDAAPIAAFMNANTREFHARRISCYVHTYYGASFSRFCLR